MLKISFLLASLRSMTKIVGSISQKHGSEDPDPDPPQNAMDPEHCLKLLEKPSALKRENPALQNMKFLRFFQF